MMKGAIALVLLTLSQWHTLTVMWWCGDVVMWWRGDVVTWFWWFPSVPIQDPILAMLPISPDQTRSIRIGPNQSGSGRSNPIGPDREPNFGDAPNFCNAPDFCDAPKMLPRCSQFWRWPLEIRELTFPPKNAENATFGFFSECPCGQNRLYQSHEWM
jgi:hypothetical protein